MLGPHRFGVLLCGELTSCSLLPNNITSHNTLSYLRLQLALQVPMSRFGTVDELIDAITWLCSDMASYVTGTAFEVDGGCAAI